MFYKYFKYNLIVTCFFFSCQSEQSTGENISAETVSENNSSQAIGNENIEINKEEQKAGKDELIDCQSTDTIKPVATHTIDWGIGLKDQDTLIWITGLSNYPSNKEVDKLLFDPGTNASWPINYDEHPSIFRNPGEAAGFFGGFCVNPAKGMVSGDAVYFCIQEYQGEFMVNVGGNTPDKVEYRIIGVTPSGEDIYQLKASIRDYYWLTLVVA